MHSDGTHYQDFVGDKFIYNFERPFSNCQIFSEKNVDREHLLLMRDRSIEQPYFLVDFSFNQKVVHGLEYSRLFESDIVNGKFLYHDIDWEYIEPTKLLVFEKLNKEPVKELGFEYSSHVTDDKFFVSISEVPTIISGVDFEFNIKWRRKFNNSHAIASIDTTLFNYAETVINNLGHTDDNIRNDGEVIALYKETGETKWLVRFDHQIHSCIVLRNRVYVSGSSKWYVICAKTGEIILNSDSKLEGDSGNSLWSDGDFLYFTSSPSDLIRVYKEEDGTFWGDIKIPSGFNIHWKPPFSKDGYHYFTLIADNSTQTGMYYGVLITSLEEIRNGFPLKIEVENYQKLNRQCVKDEGGEQYQLNFNDEELGNILRFGQIEAQKYAASNTYNHGASLDDNHVKRMNKEFNGTIKIRIEKEKLKEPLEKKLDLMCELISIACQGYLSPFGEHAVQVHWEWA